MQRAIDMLMSMCDHGMHDIYVYSRLLCTHKHAHAHEKNSWHEIFHATCGQVLGRNLPVDGRQGDSGKASTKGMNPSAFVFSHVGLVCLAHETDENR